MSHKIDNTITPPLDCLNIQGHCRVCADSRQVQAGDVFVAYVGEYADGRDHIQAAIEQGAQAVIYERDEKFRLPENMTIPTLGITHLREVAGCVADKLYAHPSHQLDIIGVTGTNGKTSITQWLAQAWTLLGKRCAVVGTVGNGFLERLQESSHTTPDAVYLQTLLADFLAQQAQAVAIEVSSHGLHQHRVSGVAFDTAVFTNLTRDHLDYHGTIEHYADSKKRLFNMPNLRHAVFNIDDEYGRLWAQEYTQQKSLRTVTYGFAHDADVRIDDFQAALNGNRFTLHTPWGSCAIHTHLLGRFNAQNLAACVAVLALHGFALADIANIVPHIKPTRGRMESVRAENAPLVVIDYAHTPDALEKALQTLQESKAINSRLWCVFGCGGNRDKGKRALMGKVANDNADCVVITSDNPRFEDPQSIIDDILPAIFQPAFVAVSRQQAIEYAICHADVEDIVLIAGKGHETYQDIQGVKHHFDDAECATQAFLIRRKS